jgi:antitoxin component YwqK of YwqJK toxin-antitoxin module
MKISKLVLIVSILFFLVYSCKPKSIKEIKVENQKGKKIKTYGLYFPEQDSISVNLNLDEYKTFEELLERFKQISCSDRIPKITIENDSIIRKIYFASFCDKYTTPIIKNKNVIEIYDDKIYRGYESKLLPLDSANNYIEKNLKNFGKIDFLSESPDKLFFIIRYESKSKLNKLEGNLLKLTKVFDKVGGNNRLNVLIMQIESPPPPPPPTPSVIEVVEDEVVIESILESTETGETDDEIVEIVEIEEVEEVSEYKIIKEYYRNYNYKDPRKLKYVGAYDDNGDRTGLWKLFMPTGEGYISSQGYYKNGKRVGHWKYYYSNGYVKAEGKLTGKLDPEYEYEMWLRTGTWTLYSEYSGKKTAEYYYDKNGKSTGNKWFN